MRTIYIGYFVDRLIGDTRSVGDDEARKHLAHRLTNLHGPTRPMGQWASHSPGWRDHRARMWRFGLQRCSHRRPRGVRAAAASGGSHGHASQTGPERDFSVFSEGIAHGLRTDIRSFGWRVERTSLGLAGPERSFSVLPEGIAHGPCARLRSQGWRAKRTGLGLAGPER